MDSVLKHGNSRWLFHSIFYITGFGLCILLWGCLAGPPSPTETSELPAQYRIDHYYGTPISGPRTGDVNQVNPEKSCRITFTGYLLESLPHDLLEPIEHHRRLITRSPNTDTVTPVSTLLKEARTGTLKDIRLFTKNISSNTSEELTSSFHLKTVLPHGVTTVLHIQDTTEPTAPQGDSLQVYVSAQPDSPRADSSDPLHIEMALACAKRAFASPDLPQDSPEGMAASENTVTPPFPGPVTERIYLQPIQFNRSPLQFAFLCPNPFQNWPIKALAITVTVEQANSNQNLPEGQQQAEWQSCLRNIEKYGDVSSTKPTALSSTGHDRTLETLYSSPNWRRALLHLATIGKAPLAEQIALSGSDDLARALSQGVFKATRTADTVSDLQALGWLIEQTAYQTLMQQAEAASLTPAQEALLLRFTGQAGRDSTTLKDLVMQSQDQNDLTRRLIAENRIALEDMSPSARYRAYTWLQGQGQAPVDFNPLASSKQRRAALKNQE